MNITYNGVTIPFFDFEVPSHLVMSLSGGIDSASLMYLTCKHFPQIEIIPVTLRDVNSGGVDATAAANITTWMKTEFPAVTIQDIQTFDYNDQDESIVTNAVCDQAIVDHPGRYVNRSSASKSIQIDNILQGVSSSYLRMNGMTLNPPVLEMQDMHQDFYGISERSRDAGATRETLFAHPVDGNKLYQPFGNVNKKFVADIYAQNDLMETLFPLTRSCVGTAIQTENFTLECHDCFWCHEKKWGFNLPQQDATYV